MYTSVLYQSLVLKPQYQISKTKMLYLEEQMKPRVEIEMKTVFEDDFTDSENESSNELVFGEEEFKKILENHYNMDNPFDSDGEWEMIIKENTITDSDYDGFFDSDSDGDFTDEEYEV